MLAAARVAICAVLGGDKLFVYVAACLYVHFILFCIQKGFPRTPSEKEVNGSCQNVRGSHMEEIEGVLTKRLLVAAAHLNPGRLQPGKPGKILRKPTCPQDIFFLINNF